jgi:ligand-binding SRPBCC domain-containing protein
MSKILCEHNRAGPRRLFRARSRVAAPAEAVWRWHERPEALADLIPPWDRVEVVSREGEGFAEGTRVTLRLRVGPFSRPWVAEHRAPVPGREFRDVQVRGPFREWDHVHRFEPDGPDACIMTDEVAYRLPLGLLGALLLARSVRRRLERMFTFRHDAVARAFAPAAAGEA